MEQITQSPDFFERNKEILQNRYQGLWEALISEDSESLLLNDINIETTPAGDTTLCIKNIYVHSQRDPVREGQRLAQSAGEGSSPVVVLGFGLGYAASALVSDGSNRPIIIIEKYRSLFLKALELRDFTDLLSRKNVIFIAGGSGEGVIDALAMANELAGVSGEKPYVIRNRSLVDLDREWYGAVEEKIHTFTAKDKVNTATLKRFGKRWVRNLSRNMSAIRDYPGVSRLEGLAGSSVASAVADQALPVFLAGAGPSLDKIKPLLNDIYKRCIVVAVDTNLRFFVKNGIQPDFVLVVDPQFWNSRHLDRCINSKTVLVAESAVYPPVMRLSFNRIFLCGSMFPLGTFIEKQVDPKGRLGAGGSVATTAWDFSRSLGAKDIWIAGLDLAYPGLKTHFKGARFEEQANSETCRLNPVETWVARALRDGFPFNAPSACGGQVLTDKRLSLYAAWFENQFRIHSNVNNHGLFPEGLKISGLHAAKIESLLALPDRREEIDKRINAAFLQTDLEFNAQEETCNRAERYENAVSSLMRGLRSVKIAAEEGADIARRALVRQVNPMQQKKVLDDLDEITQRISNSEVKEVAGFLFPGDIKEGASSTAETAAANAAAASDPFKVYLKSTLDFFNGITEAVLPMITDNNSV